MSKRRVLVLIAAVFLVVFGGTACQDRTLAVKPSSDVSDLPATTETVPEQDPDLVTGVLPNGFRYVLLHNTTPKNRVSMHLNVQAGSLQELDSESGIAHYLEHMLFNGSTHFKPGELVEYFQSIGMQFGPDANAHTSFYETVYDILLPDGNRDEVDKGLMVLSDFAAGALLHESEVERERGVILAEKRERDSVRYRTFKKTLAFELPGSLVPQRMPIGTDAVIENADRDLLKGFYNAWYRPDTMMVVMVGDFETTMAEELIRSWFSGLEAKGEKRDAPVDTWTPHTGIKALYHYEPEAGKTDISIQTVVEEPKTNETLTAIRRRVLEDIASDLLQHRLTRLIRQNKAPFTDAGMYAGTFLQNVHFSVLTAESSPDRWEDSLVMLEKMLRQAIEFGFTESELERVKADRLQELETAVKEASTRKSGTLARMIIGKENRGRVVQSPRQEQELLKPFIDSLTVADVNEAFKTLWQPGHRLIEVTGTARLSSDITAAENRIIDVYKAASDQPVTPPAEEQAAVFPYLPEPESMGEIVVSKELSGLDARQVVFKNNVTLNVKKTDFSSGEFLFKVIFGDGRCSEPGTLPGLSHAAAGVINTSGFGKMTRSQLEEALAGRQVSAGFDVEDDAFVLRGSAGSGEVDLVCQLIRTYFLDPGFSPEALTLFKKRYRQMIEEKLRTPDGLMAIRGERYLASDDSRFGFPDSDAMNQIERSDIISWLAPFFSESPVEISVVGDVDPDRVIEAVARYLGTLENRRETSSCSRRGPAFPAGGKLVLDAATKIDNARLTVAYPTDDFWDIDQTRRLNILAAIVSERLRLTVREKLGAAYSPFAYNDPSRAYDGYGTFFIVVDVNPQALETVAASVAELSASLSAEGVTQKEIFLAVEPALTHIRDMKRTNSYWLNSVLSGSSRHPAQLQWPASITEGYASITADELFHLARRYFDPEKRVSIVIRPVGEQTP